MKELLNNLTDIEVTTNIKGSVTTITFISGAKKKTLSVPKGFYVSKIATGIAVETLSSRIEFYDEEAGIKVMTYPFTSKTVYEDMMDILNMGT